MRLILIKLKDIVINIYTTFYKDYNSIIFCENLNFTFYVFYISRIMCSLRLVFLKIKDLFLTCMYVHFFRSSVRAAAN